MLSYLQVLDVLSQRFRPYFSAILMCAGTYEPNLVGQDDRLDSVT